MLGAAALMCIAAVPAVSSAACGDLNNDGNVNVIDSILMSQCIALGSCPAVSPGPLCGTGSLIGCADIVADGDVSIPSGLTADLAALVLQLAGVETIFDACEGPGPIQAGCGATVTLPTETITSNRTWPASCLIKLDGAIFVADGAVLTIEPGTKIEGIQGGGGANDPPGLFILPGAKINAQGTPSAPIIFTSDQVGTARAQGNWGGVNINGRSQVNSDTCTFNAEGIPNPFGGCITDDSSGIASFLRIEQAGISFSPNNELNVFTLNAVGSQTSFNFIQAHFGLDDSIEWFGGTSNHNHLVATAFGDDGLDMQLGSEITCQFCIALQEGQSTDPGSDSRGIESDNSEFGNCNTPNTDPDFCNITLVGARNQAGQNGGSDAGILMRRGMKGWFGNAIVSSFADNCYELRDAATSWNAFDGELVVTNSLACSCGSGGTETAKDGDVLDDTVGCDTNATCGSPGADPCVTDVGTGCKIDTEAWYASLTNVSPAAACGVASPDCPVVNDQYPGLDATMNAMCTGPGVPYDCCGAAAPSAMNVCRELPDLRPGAIGDVSPTDCKARNPVFETTSYIGAIDPGASCTTSGPAAACDWLTRPWIDVSLK
jgi:hypothetical protein